MTESVHIDRRLDRMENQLERLTEALIQLASHDQRLTALAELVASNAARLESAEQNHHALSARVTRNTIFINLVIAFVGALSPLLSSLIVVYVQHFIG